MNYFSDQKIGNNVSMVMLSLVLLTIFIIIVVIYYIYFNTPPTVTLTISNQTDQTLYPFIGINENDGIVGTALNPGSEYNFYATPGFNGFVSSRSTDPKTKVLLNLASNTGSQIVIFNNQGDKKVYNLDINQEILENDLYDLSMQEGYNEKIILSADISTNIIGPDFLRAVNCPENLKNEDGSCNSPCQVFGGGYCQELEKWPDKELYFPFFDACPNCLITIPQEPKYTISPQKKYYITFSK